MAADSVLQYPRPTLADATDNFAVDALQELENMLGVFEAHTLMDALAGKRPTELQRRAVVRMLARRMTWYSEGYADLKRYIESLPEPTES